MSGRRESPRTAFRARRKSGRRPIPIIYIGEIIRPLFSQSGSGAVFVVVRAVSATPYRKTISPQTAQLSLLLLSLSMIGGEGRQDRRREDLLPGRLRGTDARLREGLFVPAQHQLVFDDCGAPAAHPSNPRMGRPPRTTHPGILHDARHLHRTDRRRFDSHGLFTCSAISENGAESLCTALIGTVWFRLTLSPRLRRRWRTPRRSPSSRPRCWGSRR